MANREDGENFKEMELWEHLAELRSRIIRSLTYIVLGMVVAWIFYDWLWALLSAPMLPIMQKHGWRFVFRSITEGFMLRLQISMVAGLILAIPGITLEMWGFIAPGLTRPERKGAYVCAPLSLFFFAAGIFTGYMVLGPAFGYFAGFVALGNAPTELQQTPMLYMTFVIKMILAFGLVFQLPVVLMFLGYVGIVTSEMLKANWRYALVGCAAIAALATPGGDAVSMVIMAAPLGILYLASIWMVAFVEKLRERHSYRPSYDTT